MRAEARIEEFNRLEQRADAIVASRPTENTSRTFNVVQLEDLLSRDLPPRENILAPWLPSQGLAMVHAPRGVGKTHFALGVAYAVASGGAYLKWAAPKPRGVLYLDGEMPAAAMQERLAAIVAASEKEALAPLHLLTPDFNRDGMPDLTTPEDQASLQRLLDDVELVIVDNISTLCRTGKENEAEGWLPVQAWALQQRSCGRSVLFIHHSGRNGNARGTSKREDVLDTIISLSHPAEYKPSDGAVFEVKFEKNRGIHGDDVEPFEARLSTDANGFQQWSIASLEQCHLERIVRMVNDGMAQKDIAAELGIAKSTVCYHVKRAKEEGRINGNK